MLKQSTKLAFFTVISAQAIGVILMFSGFTFSALNLTIGSFLSAALIFGYSVVFLPTLPKDLSSNSDNIAATLDHDHRSTKWIPKWILGPLGKSLFLIFKLPIILLAAYFFSKQGPFAAISGLLGLLCFLPGLLMLELSKRAKNSP